MLQYSHNLMIANFTTLPTSYYQMQHALEELHQIEILEWLAYQTKVIAFYTKLLLASPALAIPLGIPTGPDDF